MEPAQHPPPRLWNFGMAGETGEDREGPSPPGPINFLSWVGPGGPNYNENGPFLPLLDCFLGTAIAE